MNISEFGILMVEIFSRKEIPIIGEENHTVRPIPLFFK